MSKKIDYTQEQKDLIRQASEILKKTEWAPPRASVYISPQSGMECTCQGIILDHNCPLHRRID